MLINNELAENDVRIDDLVTTVSKGSSYPPATEFTIKNRARRPASPSRVVGYSRFYLCDLQVHTPADKSHRYGQVGGRDPNPEFAKILMQAHIDQGVGVIAVTDHNRVDWYPVLRDAGRPLGIVVFPGLEFSVNGCHLLAVWDCTDEGYHLAEEFVVTLFDPGTSRFDSAGHPMPITKGQVIEWAQRIVNSRGLAFAPHATRKGMGLFGKSVCSNSAAIAQSNWITGFDIVGSSGADVLTNPCSQFGPVQPRWFISGDVRSIEDVGRRVTWLKLGATPSLEGLRQAFLAPAARIRLPAALQSQWCHVKDLRFAESITPTWSRLGRLTVRGGFHDGVDVTFGPGLNAIIGGKGTGKSALIEIIRSVSSSPQSTSSELKDNLKRNFPANADATLTFVDAEGNTYEARRGGDSAKPRLLWDGEDVGVDVAKRLSLRLFGQRELQTLVDQPAHLREFVATLAGDVWQGKKGEEDRLATESHQLATRMEGLTEQVDRIQAIESEIVDLKEKIARWEERGVGTVFEHSQRLARVDQQVKTVEAWPDAVLRAVDALAKTLPAPTAPDHPHMPSVLSESPAELDEAVRSALAGLHPAIEKARHAVAGGASEWARAHDEERESIAAQLAEAGITDPKQVAQAQTQLAALEEQAKGSSTHRGGLEDARKQRRKALQQLTDVHRELSRIVDDAAHKLTARVGERVRVRVEPLADTSAVLAVLEQALQGQGARHEHLTRLVEHPPLEVAAAIAEGTSALAVLGCTGTTGEKVARLPLSVRHRVEEAALLDRIVVEVNLGSPGAENWRPVDKVSPGQRATAMLALALASGNAPLLIDQPEDDLDNRYIFDEVVKVLASVCETRQVIVVTHNANIPILGDAELVLALDAVSDRSTVLACGGLEEQSVADAARRILEGGDEAFRARQRRYMAAELR